MKRLFSYLFVALLALSVITPLAHSAVTPGAKCTKAGTKQTYKGKVHTCIALGSKLYWNNGVVVTSNKPNIFNLPASCNLTAEQMFTYNTSEKSGDVMYSALIVNASISNEAIDIVVYLDWFDNFGKFKTKKILIPKLLPGQALEFGDQDFWVESQNSKESFDRPLDIVGRATCKSKPYELKNKFLKGKSIIRKIGDEEFMSFDFETFIDNTLPKTLTCSPDKCNFSMYAVYKDRSGNTFGGFSDFNPRFNEIGSYFEDIEPGSSGRAAMNLLETGADLPELLERIQVVEYTIIPKF